MSNWWELYRAVFPEDTDLVSSRDTPGWLRGFFRGEGGIEGHAEFSKIDLRGPAAFLVSVGLAAGIVSTIVVVKNQTRIERWWNDEVIPTAQSAWNWITQQQEAVSQSATVEFAILSKPALDAFSREVDVALEGTRTSMSSTEAQQYLLEILMAASIIADRMRALSNARIEGGLPELASAMEKLTTQQVTDIVNRMLKTNTSLLDYETSAIFRKMFGGGHVVDGAYVPLRNESVKEALRLPGPGMR